MGTAGPWTSGRTETKWNRRFSSRPSTGGRSGAVLAVSWERANSNISGLPVSGPLRRLPRRLGVWLGRGGRRSPARGSTRRPRGRLGLEQQINESPPSGGCRRAPTVTGRLRPGPGGSGGWCITPGQDVLDRLGLLLYRRTALPGKWGCRESVPCRRHSSLPGWARDGAPGPPWWTSPSRGTMLWLSSLVERSQSPSAAPASTPGRYYPRAPVWAPWLGEPAG